MKRVLLVIIVSAIALSLSAQRASRISRGGYRPMEQALRIKFYGGHIPPFSHYRSIDHSVALGGEISYEFFTNNRRDWAVHWRLPVIGVALQAMDLGNRDELGQMVALFPYLRWDLARTTHFILSMRLGAGVAGVTRLNSANGSYFGFVGNADMEFQFNLNNEDWLTIDPGLDLFSNCGLSSTEFPMPIPYFAIGYMHRFTPYQSLTTNESRHPYARPLPDRYMVDIAADAGASNDWRTVHVALHAAYLHRATNCWLTGIGLDGDVSIDQSEGRFFDLLRQPDQSEGRFFDLLCQSKNRPSDWSPSPARSGQSRNRPSDWSSAPLWRCGLSWSNRLTMNRFHFIADFGLYLYDPNRPGEYFYKYNPIYDHAWNYFRLGAAVRLVDKLYLQLIVHTNGFRAESTAFGLSYGI